MNTSLKESDSSQQYGKFCIFMGSYIGCVVVIGAIMNSVVIFGLLRFRRDVDLSSSFIISQAFCDIICPLFAYPLSASSGFNCSWLYGYYGCQYYGFVTSYAGYASIFNLAVLSVERFVTLNYPLSRERMINRQNVTLAIVTLHTTAAVWAIIPWFGVSAYIPEGVGTMCSVQWHSDDDSTFLYSIFLIVGAYILPMMIIIYVYGRFLHEIYLLFPRASSFNNQEISQSAREIERQQTLLVFLMVMGYNLAWFPYALVCFISVIGYPEIISPVAASFPAVFAKTSNIVNPIIYCLLNKQFRTLLFRATRVSPGEEGQ
uniref:C-like opsin n=1 Tax=Tripedalia cystophora TaxID=6141 RepID=A0A059NTC8_TRICY|nr:c-like opsin [Tripedalia cystophora]